VATGEGVPQPSNGLPRHVVAKLGAGVCAIYAVLLLSLGDSPTPWASRILSENMPTPGATPTMPLLSFLAPTMPDTCVPWPADQQQQQGEQVSRVHAVRLRVLQVLRINMVACTLRAVHFCSAAM
jgi:hypothetical protein